MAGRAEQDKQAIVAELAAARARLSATGEALRRCLDVPARASESFKQHRPAWLGGAALVGLVLSKLPSRKKTVFVERATGKMLGAAGKMGALFSAAKFALTLAKPLFSDLAGGSLVEILKRFQRPKGAGQPGEPDSP